MKHCRLRSWRWLLLPLCCAVALAEARGPHYGALTDSALLRCETLRQSGQTSADACYRGLLNTATAATGAEAAWALGDLRVANDLFAAAVRAAPGDPMLKVRWAGVFSDTHQDAEAFKLYQEAMELDADNAWAKLGAGELLIGQYSKQAEQFLGPLVEGKSAPAGARFKALLLAARVAMENSELEDAAPLLERAAALATEAALHKLELLSLQAAYDQLHGNALSPHIAAALALNPNYGELYLTLGHFYDIRRRYEEALGRYREALKLNPRLWDAQVALGTGLLRDNRLTEARAQFESAYRGDPYNPITINTLRLLDSLSKFDTLVFPEADSGVAPRIIVRANQKESAVLAPYVRRLAEQSMASYQERYRHQLKAPVVIEIYNNHEDFAVRTAGMPGLGLLGVTFGHLFAMDSPSSRAINEFHWGTTLWHEMAHVYTLESTGHRVPRWLSEGLSVYEEWRTGPIKGISIGAPMLAALAEGKALPIAELDRGFIRPAYEGQVQVSYMQAGLVCEFIDREWGFDRLRALLTESMRGVETAITVQSALGVSSGEFDRRFTRWLMQEFGVLFTNLKPWQEARRAATASAAKQQWPAAIEAAQRALAWWPQDVEDGSAYVALAAAQAALAQEAASLKTLESYWRRGGHEPGALLKLARGLHAAKRVAEAVEVLQSLHYVAPFSHQNHGLHGDWLLELQQPREALGEYAVALALNPPDKAEAHYRLARAHRAAGEAPRARTQLLRALEIAPGYRPAQRLLLELSN